MDHEEVLGELLLLQNDIQNVHDELAVKLETNQERISWFRSRDHYLRCVPYRELGLSYRQIAKRTNYTIRQIHRAYIEHVSPKWNDRPFLTEAQLEEIIEYIHV